MRDDGVEALTEKKRILLVDDKPDNLRLLVSILPEHLYTAHPTTSGAAALRFVQNMLPDLILLDVMMPELSGYQVCKELKQNLRTRDIPVIFVSAGDQITDKSEAFAQGGVDYITKPFQPEEVLMRIEAHLSLSNQQKRLQERIEERNAEVARLNAQLQQVLAERAQAQQRLDSLEAVTAIVPIESKLTPRQPPANVMPIARLEAKFDEARRRRLVALVAPAGYGKSTTLARLRARVEAARIPAAWISLDDEQNDPVRFLRYLIAAFERAVPGSGAAALARARLIGTAGDIRAPLDSLCVELAGVAGEIALFLDDYHSIGNSAVHRAMDWLILNGPPNLRFLIASRADLPLTLSALRLSDELYEFGTGELSLQLDEVGAFVSAVSGQTLTTKQIGLLHRSTEGWPAGLQLASLALKGGEHVTEFVNEFSGKDKDITAYVGEILLAQMPGELVDFLTFSALFDRFSLDLCRDLFSRDKSFALLEQVKANNLFLIPLDRENHWFRYHHLFADYLRARFQHRSPDEVKANYIRASVWFEKQGMTREAIRYALTGGDYERAADMVAGSAFEMVRVRGDHGALLQWIKRMPEQYIAQRPRVRLAYAWSLLNMHRFAQAEAELAGVERAVEAQCAAGREGADDLLELARMVRCAFYGLTECSTAALRADLDWLARWERSNPFHVGTVQAILGYSAHLAHDYEAAKRFLIEARRRFELANAHFGICWVDTMAAIAEFGKGDLSEADRILARGLERAAKSLGAHSSGIPMLTLLQAQLRYEQNRLSEAQQLLDAGMPGVLGQGVAETMLAGYRTKARLLALRGLTEQAEACLCDGVSAADGLGMRRLSLALELERIALLLETRQTARAAAALPELRDACGALSEADECVQFQLLEARLQLAGGQAEAAYASVRRVAARVRQSGRAALAIKLLCVKAAAQSERGAADEALRTMDEAIGAAMAGGMVRTLADQGPLASGLLEQVAARRAAPAHAGIADPALEFVQRALARDGAAAGPRTPAAAELPRAQRDDFYERELQILKLIESGLGNREVAAQLFLSEATVKWHLHNIFEKLKVSNRSGAVARARQLGLM